MKHHASSCTVLIDVAGTGCSVERRLQTPGTSCYESERAGRGATCTQLLNATQADCDGVRGTLSPRRELADMQFRAA